MAYKTRIYQHATTGEDFPVADNFWHAMSEKEKQPLGIPSKGCKTTSSLKVTEGKKDMILAPLGKKGSLSNSLLFVFLLYLNSMVRSGIEYFSHNYFLFTSSNHTVIF